MDDRSLELVAAACAGELLSGSPARRVTRVCTDSRQVQTGDLFIALRGEKFDGHDFVPAAAKKAAAVVVERTWAKLNAAAATSQGRLSVSPGPDLGDCALIVVADTRQALGRLAAAYRRDFRLPIAVVAGSNGKTTTKELVASVLRQRFNTLSSEASFNNDIGVPLTLLRLESSHQAAVVEAGTNHPGELAPLVRMISPSYGILTGIAREHLEFFGDLAGVAREEGWLAELLPAGGTLLLNGDTEWAGPIAQRTRASIRRVGFASQNDWRVVGVRLEKQGLVFKAEGPQPDFCGEYRLRLVGRHQALNALFAVALGVELGLSRSEIEQGLLQCQPAKMRLQVWESGGVRVLDDAYNANADSMVAALQTLQELPCRGRRVAVLGDMAEQGSHSEAAHQEVGRRAAELGIGQLFTVGRMAAVTAQAARDAGLTRVLDFPELDSAAVAVKRFVREGDLVLLKASRASRLERIGEALRAQENGKKTEPHSMLG